MKKKVEKDNSERWLLTYSDLMNLLLILFIVLYSMSKIDSQKAKQLALALQKGFNGGVPIVTLSTTSGTSLTPTGTSSTSSISSSVTSAVDYTKLYQQIVSLVNQQGMQGKIIVQLTKNGVIISLNEAVLFARGSADLNTSSVNLIKMIGNVLGKVSYSQLIVEGYTDSDPIHNQQFQDNRDLSSMRANNVARILQYRCAISPEKISALGYGEYRPVAPNNSDANKAKNRRVVLTLLKPEFNPDATMTTDKLASVLNSQP